MTTNIDYTSLSTQYVFDINKSRLFMKDSHNFYNVLGKEQLNTIENTSLYDMYLSSGNIIEPHYHPNSAELIYCISGSLTAFMLNPFTNQLLNFEIIPGKVLNIPHAWWHYEKITMDNTHILSIFDAPNPEVILESNILKLTPSNIMANTYCINEEQWKNIIKDIKPNTHIGPYNDCSKNMIHQTYHNYIHQKHQQNSSFQYPYI